jgi:hypothetical protein
MPASPPQLGKAERLAQPVNGFLHVGVDEFWNNTG